MVNISGRKTTTLLIIGIGLLLVILANQLSALWFYRIDLTEEKRYTISDATKQALEDLQGEVFIEVYLEGELPPSFQRLQRAIKETLEEFRIYSNGNVKFKFSDPDKTIAKESRRKFYEKLTGLGIQPTNIIDSKDGKRTERIIIPGAVVSYGTREAGTLLLRGNKGQNAQEQLNQSIENLEYEFVNAIKKVTSERKKRIALMHDLNGADTLKLAGLTSALTSNYALYTIDIERKTSLVGYDAVIIAGTKKPFNVASQYKIDQYLINGGNLLMFIDRVYVNMDSISGPGTLAMPIDLGLDEMLFKYGARLNNDILLDLNSGVYPVVVGNVGNQSDIKLMPWYFYPLVNHYSEHPTVKNLDAILMKFVSSIDTVKSDGITKTPLLFSSQYSMILQAPMVISLNDLKDEIRPEYFNKGEQPLTWLLEGSFTSVYKNRFLPKEVNTSSFREDGSEAKLLISADANIIYNDINPKTGQPIDLGVDPFTMATYANKDFVINAINYMLDDDGIIEARKKEVKIRPLDKVKIEQEKLKWQLINLISPILVLIIFALVKGYVRKRNNTRRI